MIEQFYMFLGFLFGAWSRQIPSDSGRGPGGQRSGGKLPQRFCSEQELRSVYLI